MRKMLRFSIAQTALPLLFTCLITSLSAQTVYLHNFGTTTISTHPYTVAPNIFDTNLSSSSWSNSTGVWTNLAGASGQAIAIPSASNGSTATLTFNVNGGYALSVSQYRFYIRRATTAPTTWSMTINGNAVGSGTILTAGATTGFISTSVTGLTGIVSVVLTFTGGTGSGSIRIDDFRLDGSNCTAPTITLGASPSVCQGITSANLPYSATAGSPDQYKIDYDAAAESAGFVDVSYTALPATPIALVVPGAAPGAVYNATLKVRKAATPGCESASMPFTVTVSAPPAPVVTPSPAASVCTGTNVTLSTTAFSSYAWSSPPGGSTQSVMHTPVSNTTYTVTVTNATGCSGTGSVTVSVVSQPGITLGASPAVCQGTTTANLTYSGTTGGPNEYMIDYDATANSNGLVDVAYTTLPASPIVVVVPGAAPAATYNATIRVRSGSGCESDAVAFTVTVRSLPSATITGAMTACSNAGGNTASTTAGLSNYSWSITNGTITAGGTTNSITYTAGTSGTVTLNVTVTDANGCMASSSKMVVINALPTASISAASPVCANTTGNTATASGGTGYSWGITNGTITSGAGISTVTYTAGASGTTTLSVTVTDANGCTATATQAVTLTPAPSAAITATPSAVCSNSTGNTASTPDAGMGATYFWSITGGTITLGAGTNSITYTAGVSGTVNLSVQVTSGSCMVTGSTSVTINPLPSSTITATPTAVCANSTGNTASVPNAGVGATYVWTINNGNITSGAGTSSITYSVTASSPVSLTATVTANGCSTTGNTSVTVNPLPTITLGTSPSVCRGLTSADLPYSATTGGADQYSIDYDVLANGAGFADVANAALPATPIVLVVPGGASAGLYNATLTVRNSVTGCVSSSTAFTILLRVQPTITATSNSPVCEGATLDLNSTPAGGTPPYTVFAWAGPSYSDGTQDPVGFTATLASAGTYTVTVTDMNGCTGTGTTVVVVNPLPTITLGTHPAVCRGVNSANLPYSATTGSPNQYSIDYDGTAEAAGFVDVSNQTLSATPIGLTVPTLAAAAVYNATITVRNTTTGCVSSPVVPFTIVINANPTIAAGNTGPVCVGAMVTVSSTPTGGSNVYSTFAWQGPNGFTAAVEDPAAFATVAASAGTYTVTVTDNNGCSGTGSTTVVLQPLPTIAMGVTPMATACVGATSANLPYFGTSNSPDQYSIDFDPAAETAGLADVVNAALPASPIVINTTLAVTPGTYNGTLTVRNSTTGCVSSSTAFTVVINALPSALITANAACSNSTGNTASVPSAGMGANYSWTATNGTITSGATTNSVMYTAGASGTVVFNVTVTDAVGCSATGSTSVNINPLPSTTITAAPTSVCASSTGNTAFVPAAGGAAMYTWALTDGTITAGQGSTTITYSAFASGTVGMLVTVTDGNGCSATGTHSVVINPAPSAVITTPLTICSNANGTASVPDAGMGATYNWSVGNGLGTSSTNILNYTAGMSGTVTLNVTVTYLGCPATGTASISINPLPNGSLADATICSVGGVGMLTFTSDAGTGPFQIAYNSGGPTQVAGGVMSGLPFMVVPNPTSTTTYTITGITDANTCSRIAGFTDGQGTITVTPIPTASISYAGSPYCSTGGTAMVTLTGTNAYTGGTYSASAGLSINSGSGDVNIGASTPGTYTVSYTVAASGGCPAVTATASIVITALPTASISYSGSPYCTNHDGPATATLNGTGAYTGGTYSASPAGLAIDGSTGLVTLGMSMAGTYTVTYTLVASSGCPMVTATTTIVVVAAPVASIDASPSTTVCPGEMVTLTASGGTSYLWNTPSMNAVITVTPEITTTYIVTVTQNGCSDTESIIVNVPVVSTLVLDLIADPDPVECGELTTLTVQAMSGFTDITSLQYSVQWDPAKFTYVSAVPVVIGGEIPSIFSNPMAGNVTYSWGSISLDGDDLSNDSPLLNVILKAKASSGSADASITGSPAPIDATNPSFCSMTVTVPVNPLSIELSNNPPTPFTADNNGPKCAGLDLGLFADISEDSTGTSPYTFLWEGPNMFSSSMEDPTINSATVDADGIYTVTVSDADGCTAVATTTAVVKPTPTVTASNNGPLCAGSTLNLTADQTGGIGFSWEGPNMFLSSTEDPSIPAVTTLAAGIYTVTVTGENECSATASTSVVIHESPTFSFVIGGSPVSSINNGIADPSEAVTVTECDGGTYTIADLIQAPANIRYTITVMATGGGLLFDGGAAGAADIAGAALSGAQGTHTLTLSNPAMGGTVVQTITPYNDVNNDGDYDAGIDCPGDAITITYVGNPIPNAGTITGIPFVCVGSGITLLSNGTAGGEWSSSSSNATVSNGIVMGVTPGPATIIYTVTDITGCSSSTSFVVTVNALPNAGTISGSSSVCVGSMTTLSSDGDAGGMWSSLNPMIATVNTGEVTGVSAGTTTIVYTVTDMNGCIKATSASITVNALPTPVIAGNLSFCTGGSTTLTVSESASYMWNTMPVGTTQSVMINTPGTYTVMVTDVNGCTASTSATVTSDNLTITDHIPGNASTPGTRTICHLENTNFRVQYTSNVTPTFLWQVSTDNGMSWNPVVLSPGVAEVVNTAGQTRLNLSNVPNTYNGYQYRVIITAGACETTTQAFNLVVDGPIEFTVQPVDQTICVSQTSATFTATVTNGGAGTINYRWQYFSMAEVWTNINDGSTGATGQNSNSLTLDNTYSLWPSVPGSLKVRLRANTPGCGNIFSDEVTLERVAAPGASISGATSFCTGSSTVITASGGTSYIWDDMSTNPVRTITTAGAYTVTVTGESGCTSSTNTMVTVNPRPALNAILNSVTVTDNNDGITDTGSFAICNVPNNVTFGSFTDLNLTGPNVRVYQSISYTNTSSPFCNNCSGGLGVFTGSGTASLINPALPGTMVMRFLAWVDTDIDGNIDADECTGDSVVYTVTVSPLPDAGTITGSLSVCVGSTTTLTSNGASGGTWTSSSPNATVAGGIVTGVTAGTSTITYTVTAGGCTSSVSVVVTVNPAPIAVISGNPTFCTGGSTTLTASGGSSYLWDDATTNAVRTITVAGTYTVIVTGANGCTDSESITVTEISAGVTNLNTGLTYCRIQDAINAAETLAGHIIEAGPGTYYENVLINKQGLTVRSSGGKGATTIIGTYAGGNNATVAISSGINGVTLQGFTIIGFDGTGAIEAAAVYLVGSHTGITIEGNEIRANGDHGLLADYNAAISGIVINSNMFTGQTFLGSEPGGCGFGTQFDPGNNVPRQLVTMGGGAGVTNSMNVTFTNNMVTGTAGAASSQAGCEATGQGNTLVTIDVLGANISGNLFAGTTARFATSLRARGTATSVCNNTFESDGLLGAATAHIFFGSAAPLTGATPNTLAGVASDNAFPDGGYYLTPDHANSWIIFRDLTQANAAIAANAAGQSAVGAATTLINPGVISGTTTICVGAMTNLASNGAAGGTWSSSDPLTASVDNTGKVTGLAGGTVTITYTVTATGGCTSTATTTVTVNPLPAPVITGALSFCTGDSTTLTVGAFASYAWSTMATTPGITVHTAGTYTVTVTSAGGCSASASATVTVNPRPALQATVNTTTVTDNNDGMDNTGSFTVCNVANNLSFGPFVDLSMTVGNVKVYQTVAYTNATASFCNNCAAVPAAFTGSGTVSLANPALPGQLVMSFRAWVDTNNDSVIDAGECAGDWVVYTITVNPVPDAGIISGAGPVCVGSAISLNSTGAPGGTWSSSDTLIAKTNGSGVVTGIAAGTATITYAVTANNCSSTTSAVVTVNDLPVVTCPANISVCANTSAFVLTGGSPTGGTYSGTGVSAGMFDPAIAGVGTHTITYSYTDGNMCMDTCLFTITVNTLPFVTCPASTAVCINVPAFTISGGAPEGGTYSGTGVNMSGDMFDPLSATVGTYTITYTYNNGCTNTCTFNIEVKSLPVVTCPANLTVCADEPAFAFMGETPIGGTFSGTGVSSGMFNPATAGVGVQTITYTVTGENECTNTCTFTVTVNALPTFAFTAQVGARPAESGDNNGGPATVTIHFCAGESFALSGFSASPVGQVGFTASYTASGNVTYNGSNIGASGSSPIAPGGAAAFFAATYGPYALDDAAASGWITQIFTPYNDVNMDGDYDAGIDCEGSPITLQYNIYANPDVIATPAAQTICEGGATNIALTSSVANTTFAWVVQSTTGTVTGQSVGTGNTIEQTLNGSGTVTYRITPTGPGPNNCTGAYTDVTITVNPRPTAVISGSTTICTGNMATLTINLTGTGPWSGTLTNGGPAIPFSGPTSPIMLSVSTMSTTTYTLSTLLDANCTAIPSDLTGSATVTVNSLTAGTIGTDQTVCSNGDPAMLTETTPATGGGTLTYRWESSTTAGCSTDFATIMGATDATYDPPTGLTTTTYYRRVTISTLNSVSCEAVSNCVTVIVNAVTAGSIADNQTVCPGGDPAAFTEASSASGVNLSYRWESSTTPGCTTGFTPIATGITYDPPSGLTTTTYYRRVAIATQNDNSCEAVSNCVTVTVEDNTPPTITCPANSTIAADASCTNLLGTWQPVATFDACGTVGVTQTPAASTLLDGHDDFEVVTLTANDGNGNTATCTLTVTLKDVTAPAFDCNTLAPITVFTDAPFCHSDTDISVPVALDNCEGPISAIGTRSDLIPINSAWPGSSPTTVTWTFTDPAGNVKTCTQTVTVLDNDAPMITCPPNISTQDNDPDMCGAEVDFISLATATDNCGGVPTISYLPATGSFLPVGTTTVIATANDGRGNTGTCTFTVTIQDTQRPAFAFCPGNITVTPNGNSCNYTGTAVLNPTGMDNCAGFILNNSYNHASSLVGASFAPSSTTTVTWTVTDAAGNTNTTTQACSYTVTVGPCISISGMICWKNFGADPMAPNVGVGMTTVSLTGAATAVDVTPATGLYTVVASVVPGNYTVTPTKNINITNGLTSLDALRVQQHATGAMPFTDPFMLIAADVNRNNVVNTTDATLINQVILGNPSALAIFNKSWRFVPKSWSPTIIPWGFPETLTFSPLTGSAINQDFWGIKLGDLVVPYTNPANKPSAPPTAVVWTVQDEALEAGQEVEAEFRVNNFENIGSYQFALHFDAAQLEVLDILPTQALSLSKADNFGTFNVANGELRTVWSTPQGAYLTGGTRVFRVKFRALESGSLLSEVLRLDESVMVAEAAKTDLQVVPVELVFTKTSASKYVVGQSAQLHLMQNRPNPVVDRTSIGFELPQACEATLRIVDAMGRVITERTATYTAGYHEERFRLEEVGAPGVLYYELITPYGQLSNKMMLIER